MGSERDIEADIKATAEDIKATADDIAADAQHIRQIENEKAHLNPADPRIVELAAESQVVAAHMADKTEAEMALVNEAHQQAVDRVRPNDASSTDGDTTV